MVRGLCDYGADGEAVTAGCSAAVFFCATAKNFIEFFPERLDSLTVVEYLIKVRNRLARG